MCFLAISVSIFKLCLYVIVYCPVSSVEPQALWEPRTIHPAVPRIPHRTCQSLLKRCLGMETSWMAKESVAASQRGVNWLKQVCTWENLWCLCIWVRSLVVLTPQEVTTGCLINPYTKQAVPRWAFFFSCSLTSTSINCPLLSSPTQTLFSSKVLPHLHKRFHRSLDLSNKKKILMEKDPWKSGLNLWIIDWTTNSCAQIYSFYGNNEKYFVKKVKWFSNYLTYC